MKRIITLLITAGAFASLSAQTPNEEAKRIILGGSNKKPGSGGTQSSKDIILGGGDDRRVYDESGNRYPDNNPYGSSRDAQIDQVNGDYDAKVNSIRNNPYLSNTEKETIIRRLNNERAQKIRRINDQYNGNRNDTDDRYSSNKKYKKDNGKHLGWEKGKGNGKKYKKHRKDD